jgi:hypothetical protein
MLGHGGGPFVCASRSMPFVTAPARFAAAVGLLFAIVGACGPAVAPRLSASPAGPGLTPVPGAASAPPASPAASLPGTTDTEFGRIWDGLPAWFPIPAGAVAIDDRAPSSGSYALGMDVDSATRTIADALRARGLSVNVGSPLEDGSVVIDVGGAAEGCVSEVRLTPRSGTVSMSVLYGASCPFD